MKFIKYIIVIIIITTFAIVLVNLINKDGKGGTATRDANSIPSRLGQSCIPTHTSPSIGNQAATNVVSANRSRAWLYIQQPLNATNTVSLNLGGTAVSGQGINLGTSTNGWLDFPLSFELGIQVNRPATTSVSAITGTGSTTVNVIDCIYD